MNRQFNPNNYRQMVDSSPSLLHEPQPAELDLASDIAYYYSPSPYHQNLTTMPASYFSETSEQTYHNICVDGTTFTSPANQQYWLGYSSHYYHTAAYGSAYDNTSAAYCMPSYATGNHYPQIGGSPHGQHRGHVYNSKYHIEDSRNNYATREKNWNKEQGSSSKYQGDVNNLPLILNVEAVKARADCRTSLMIRNIPNKYTQQTLMYEFQKNGYGSDKIDFFYLPIDFKNKCNRGYAFVNFVDVEDIVSFFNRYNGQRWNVFNSEKICVIMYARIQGKEAFLRRFEHSEILCKEGEFQPLFFISHGSEKGIREILPKPDGCKGHSITADHKSTDRKKGEALPKLDG